MSNNFINLWDWRKNLVIFFVLVLGKSIDSFCVRLVKFGIVMWNFGVIVVGKFVYCVGFLFIIKYMEYMIVYGVIVKIDGFI